MIDFVIVMIAIITAANLLLSMMTLFMLTAPMLVAIGFYHIKTSSKIQGL